MRADFNLVHFCGTVLYCNALETIHNYQILARLSATSGSDSYVWHGYSTLKAPWGWPAQCHYWNAGFDLHTQQVSALQLSPHRQIGRAHV